MTTPITLKEASEALDRAAEALRRTGSLFHVIAHARRTGLEELLNTFDMAEIGISISAELAEASEEWAELCRSAAKGQEVAQ